MLTYLGKSLKLGHSGVSCVKHRRCRMLSAVMKSKIKCRHIEFPLYTVNSFPDCKGERSYLCSPRAARKASKFVEFNRYLLSKVSICLWLFHVSVSVFHEDGILVLSSLFCTYNWGHCNDICVIITCPTAFIDHVWLKCRAFSSRKKKELGNQSNLL